jgi:hypothetical protein
MVCMLPMGIFPQRRGNMPVSLRNEPRFIPRCSQLQATLG